MPFVQHMPKRGTRVLLSALLLFGVSCTKQEGRVDPAGNAGERVQISATVSPEGQTRSYIEEGTVENGTFYLFYRIPGSTTSYKMATVDFGDPEGPATGFAYILDGDTRKDLKWKNVYGEGKSSLSYYLCNVNPDLYTVSPSYWSVFRFNKEDAGNPFVVGPLDEVNGTNDILSGSITKGSMTGKKLEFTLDHALSLLKINIDVYPAGEEYIDLTNAEVTISNLCTTVGAFSLTTPTNYKYDASLAPTSNTGTYREISETPVLLVDPSDKEIHCWQDTGIFDEDGAADGPARYSTKRFVFPPQTIPPTEGAGRPVLTVKVPRKDALGGQSGGSGEYVTYAGWIPEIMFNDNYVPEDIALKSGYQLTITASIESPSPELTFAPVRVERWINKGDHAFKIKQAGIYNGRDFMDLIKLYEKLQIPDLSEEEEELCLMRLEKYGYRDENDCYVFQLWANVTLDLDDLDEIKGKMAGNAPEFAFMFNKYTVTLTDGSSETQLAGAEGQMELYSLVTGQSLAFKGITDKNGFLDLLKRLNGEVPTTLWEMMQYGVLNNYDDTIVFDINASFEVDWADVYQSIPAQFRGYDISFTIHAEQEVKVRFPVPNDGVFIPCRSGEYCPLSKLIPKKTAGVSSAGEFYFLTECYNKYFPLNNDILRLFGKVSGSTWTFEFRDMMTLEGSKTFLSMIPDKAAGKPDYGISILSSNTVTIEDERVPASTSSSSVLYSMLSGTGKATAQTSLGTIVNSYNNSSYNRTDYQSLWSYGRFDAEQNRWIFPLNTKEQYIVYSNLFGKMVPNEAGGKYDYEFDLGDTYLIVRSVPNDDDLDTSSDGYRYFYQEGSDAYAYPNTAADLKRMALGTYWDTVEPAPEP